MFAIYLIFNGSHSWVWFIQKECTLHLYTFQKYIIYYMYLNKLIMYDQFLDNWKHTGQNVEDGHE